MNDARAIAENPWYMGAAMRVLIVAIAVTVSTAGCIIQAPTSEGTQSPSRVLPPAPPIEVKVGANFADKAELTTAIISPSRGAPGETVKVLCNYKVNAAFDTDYTIFVHAEDVDGRVDRINVDHTPGRGTRPTSSWKAGEIIRDEFDIPIPPGYPVRGINVLLGFWDPRTDARAKIVNAEQVRTDGHDRLLVANFPVAPAQ